AVRRRHNWNGSPSGDVNRAPAPRVRPPLTDLVFEEERRTNSRMFACVDVDYRDTGAVAACVLFREWTDGAPAAEVVERLARLEAYEPGQLYRRELPCLLAVLSKVHDPLQAVVVDGYVWLGGEDRPGLGWHLYAALGESLPVIGVAKSYFEGVRVA